MFDEFTSLLLTRKWYLYQSVHQYNLTVDIIVHFLIQSVVCIAYNSTQNAYIKFHTYKPLLSCTIPHVCNVGALCRDLHVHVHLSADRMSILESLLLTICVYDIYDDLVLCEKVV